MNHAVSRTFQHVDGIDFIGQPTPGEHRGNCGYSVDPIPTGSGGQIT